MKSRSESAAWTDTDGVIWMRVVERFRQRHGSGGLWVITQRQEVTDADLMYDSVAACWTPEAGKLVWWGDQMIDVGGAVLGKGMRR